MKRMHYYRPLGVICVIMLTVARLSGQDMSVQALPPDGALVQKSQLWNLMITNTAASVQSRKLSMTVIDRKSNRRVLSALSNVFLVSPGARLYQLADMMPVMYNALSPAFNGTDFDFLPAGDYQVCYELLGDKGSRSGVSCVPVSVKLLSGPQLQAPQNNARVSVDSLAFSWTPPTPEPLLPDALYAIRLVHVEKGQTAENALKENPVLFSADQLSSLSLLYPATATRLENNRHYAWKVTAYNDQQEVVSVSWSFETGDPAQPKATDGQVYTKLEKEGVSAGYSLVSRYLRFSFDNESADSLFQVTFIDVTGGRHEQLPVDSSLIPRFIRGINHVQIDLPAIPGVRKKHLYELRLTDARRQSWKMTFQYQ